MRLSETTVLTSLHVGSWTGRIVDGEVSDEVSERHHAELKGAGNYNKQLISKKFLHQVNSKISLVRRVHRLLTSPWDDDARICSNQMFTNYSEQMRLGRLGVEGSADEFCANLGSYINEARTRLGTMFDLKDYLTAEAIRKKFYVDVEIKAVPESGDFRAELRDDQVKAITKDIERRTEQRLEAAIDDVFKRVEACTDRMVEKLRGFTPKEGERAENGFKDSLVWNIKELAELIPALNITNDKRLDQLHNRLLADLVQHSPDSLRDNDRLRNDTADKAEKILAKVRSYLA